jgi:hypothetical protein
MANQPDKRGIVYHLYPYPAISNVTGPLSVFKGAVAQTALQSSCEEPSGESKKIPLAACTGRKKIATSSLG